jgi:uncharacterized protein with gpF-like domain
MTDPFNLPFKESIEFFRGKLNLPTQSWRDVLGTAHDLAFMVAGAQDADLITDLRRAIDGAISVGESIGKFRQKFKETVERLGWTGWTGESTKKGKSWRQWIIYDTNVRQSYNAGREKQMANPALLKRRPYRMYRHGGSIVPRDSHLALNRKVFLATDPFWNTGSPANGYGCSCSSNLLNERDVKRLGLKVEDPPKGFKPDEGFDYRPGGDDVRKMYENMKEKADNYTPELKENFNKYLGEGNGN